MEFMPESAPLVILTFLGTCFALCATVLVIAYGLARGKPTLAKYAGIVALGGAPVYAGLLLAASLTSTEKVLRAGGQKYFCEVDCRGLLGGGSHDGENAWPAAQSKEHRRNVLCGEGEDVVR